MIKTETKIDKLKSIKLMPYFAGSIVSLICALVLILAFAFIMRYFAVSSALITPVNIAIKIVSIAVGTAVATKNGTKGLLKGAVVGFLFVVLCEVVFAIISKSFVFGLGLFANIAMSVVVGMISGIIFVNLRKN